MSRKDLCRTCLKPCDSNKENMFAKGSSVVSDLNFLLTGHRKTLLDRDSFSQLICQPCKNRLVIAVGFVKQVIQAQDELHRESADSDKLTADVQDDFSVCDDEPFSPSEEDVEPALEPPAPKATEASQKVSCEHCSRKFSTKFRLKCHMMTHTGERPFICKVCQQAFRQSNALKCHMRIHTGERPYQCKVCEKRFSQNTVLKTHMTLHTGKAVSCQLCEKKFSRRSYLIQHMREHTGARPYICEICSMSYKQKSHLDHHLSVHSGVKHPCSVCGKQYSKKWSLKVHMYSHETDIKMPHPCSHCEKSFPLRSKLLAHMNTRHQNQSQLEVAPEASNTVEVEETQEMYSFIQVLNPTVGQIFLTRK